MTQTRLNRRLTTLDSTFLYFEKAEQPMHIGGCMLYEGRIRQVGTVEEMQRTEDPVVRQFIEGRPE